MALGLLPAGMPLVAPAPAAEGAGSVDAAGALAAADGWASPSCCCCCCGCWGPGLQGACCCANRARRASWRSRDAADRVRAGGGTSWWRRGGGGEVALAPLRCGAATPPLEARASSAGPGAPCAAAAGCLRACVRVPPSALPPSAALACPLCSPSAPAWSRADRPCAVGCPTALWPCVVCVAPPGARTPAAPPAPGMGTAAGDASAPPLRPASAMLLLLAAAVGGAAAAVPPGAEAAAGAAALGPAAAAAVPAPRWGRPGGGALLGGGSGLPGLMLRVRLGGRAAGAGGCAGRGLPGLSALNAACT